MTKIIRDINGGRLRLTKTTLTEIDGFNYGPFRLRLNILKGRATGGRIHATAAALNNPKTVTKPSTYAYITINYIQRTIGCRTFGKRTFAQILKTADAK